MAQRSTADGAVRSDEPSADGAELTDT